MVTVREIELLAGLLQRAGVTKIEAIWANNVMDRLRAQATIEEPKQKQPKPKEKKDA